VVESLLELEAEPMPLRASKFNQQGPSRV